MAENHPEIQVTETENMKLPKNIRQMGKPSDKQKVYIEDYVYTYLHNFLKEKYREDTLKAAVILGEYHKKDGVIYAFVKGAVSCEFSQLHEDVSKELTQTIRSYFSGWDMLGWYVSSQGVDAHIQSEIKHHYARCAAAAPQYLVYEDELERDIQVFAWEQNALQFLGGYYIYYEKNPRMQEFLIMEKGGRPQELPTIQESPTTRESPTPQEKSAQNTDVHDRPPADAVTTEQYKANVSKTFNDMRELVQEPKPSGITYRRKAAEEQHQARRQKKQAAEKKNKKPQRIVYAACAAVLVVLVAMGVTQMGNYQNLKQLQETISSTIIPAWNSDDEKSPLSEEALEQPTSSDSDPLTTLLQDGSSISDTDTPIEQLPPSNEVVSTSSDIEEPASTDADEASTSDATEIPSSVQEETPSSDAETTPEVYVVKKGDSLYSISRAIYENEDMVESICELNGITNLHLIFEGQKLKLP